MALPFFISTERLFPQIVKWGMENEKCKSCDGPIFEYDCAKCKKSFKACGFCTGAVGILLCGPCLTKTVRREKK